LKLMTENVFVSEVRGLMYVALNRGRKKVPYGVLFGTIVCIML
jgi:hypothetical protein